MKLKDFRTYTAGLSQKELAQQAGIAKSTVAAIEQGKPFRPLTAGKILAALSKHVGRPVDRSEIDEFKEPHD